MSSTNSAPTKEPVNKPILYLCGHFKKGHRHGNSCHELLKLQEPFFLYDRLSIFGIFEVVMNPHVLLHLSPVITVIAFIWSVCWDIILYPSFSISKLPFNNSFMHFQNNYDNPDKTTAKPLPSLLL